MFSGSSSSNNNNNYHEGPEGRRRERERTPSKSQPPVPANVQQLVSSVSPGSSQEQQPGTRPLPPRDISLPTLAGPGSQPPVSYPISVPPPVQLSAVPEAGPEIPNVITSASNRYEHKQFD